MVLAQGQEPRCQGYRKKFVLHSRTDNVRMADIVQRGKNGPGKPRSSARGSPPSSMVDFRRRNHRRRSPAPTVRTGIPRTADLFRVHRLGRVGAGASVPRARRRLSDRGDARRSRGLEPGPGCVPGSRRAARDCSPSLLFRWTLGSHVRIRPMRTGRLVADRRRPRRGSTTVRTRNLRRLPARPAPGHVRPRRVPVSRCASAHQPPTPARSRTSAPRDGRATQAGRVRLSSDHDAFDLVERDRVRRPVVQLRRPGRRVAGNLLGVLERPPVRQIRRDTRRPERVAARRRR